jgi:hypothetical protein
MDTPTSPECAIFEDPLLLCDVVALAMPALVSVSDLLSLTTLELTACIPNSALQTNKVLVCTGLI